jgi:hypothetical protein
MKFKLRPKLVHRILTGNSTVKMQSAFAIEICVNGKWTLVGDDDRPFYFKTATRRDVKLKELRGMQMEDA